jgi:thiazolylpeptide-type bacteriocin precursor
VRSLAPGSALPDDVIAAVVERREGVPLFVEELTKAVLEAGSRLGSAARVSSATCTTCSATPTRFT